MPTGDLTDPFVNFNYSIELDGIERGSFQEVGGLEATVDVIEHREGGNITPRKLAGQVKYAPLTLKWGMTSDMELAEWHQSIVEGRIDRRNGSVVLHDRTGREVARWNFERAWPTKYTGPSLSAEASDVAIETLELVHEKLERVS